MTTLHLKDFAKERGQPEASLLLGLTQGALSKAIRVGRNIIVTCEADGSYTAEERRPFPSRAEPKVSPIRTSSLKANLPGMVTADKTGDPAGFLSSTAEASQ